MVISLRKSAEWLLDDHTLYYCSNCKKTAPYYIEEDQITYWPQLNFCPYCGSTMNKKSKRKE